MKVLFALLFVLSTLMPAGNAAHSASFVMAESMDHSSMQMSAIDRHMEHDCCEDVPSDEGGLSTTTSANPCHSDSNCQHCEEHCFSTSSGLVESNKLWQPMVPERIVSAFFNPPTSRTEAFFKPPMHS